MMVQFQLYPMVEVDSSKRGRYYVHCGGGRISTGVQR